MNPVISDKKEKDNVLLFRISNTHLSFVNAMRRIMLSDIPTVVLKNISK